MTSSNACYTYDFVYSAERFESENALLTLFKGLCKKYVFQLEQGESSGYLHYQGRLSLIKKVRPDKVLKIFKEKFRPNWIKPTVKNQHNEFVNKGDAFYQMKEQTRLKGPWCDKDEVIYIPRQIREVKQLRPFQQTIIDSADNWDTRNINLVYCPEGNKGKSILVGYCRAYKIGRALPPVNDFKDMMRMVCDMPTAKMYLVDMPRSLNKDRLYQFYSGIETIKDGYAYDDRYKFKEKFFDCPNIWIFSNILPDMSMLSKDRWKLWSIDKEYELKAIKEDDLVTLHIMA
ncbi:MAG: replication protein [Circoviridae sp.]|nr:MAG: replication protein [Circoviridae sp.]